MRPIYELTSDEEETLRYLINAYGMGQDLRDIVDSWRWSDFKDEDASRRFADCKGLAECGFLEMELDESGALAIDGLTSAGRCYFKDRAERQRRERRLLWKNKAFQIGLSVATLILSATLSIIGGVAIHYITENGSLDEYAEQISRAYHHRYGGDSQAESEQPAEDSGQEIVHEERLADNPVDGSIE